MIIRAGPLEKFENFFSGKSHSAENCRTVPKLPYVITLRKNPNLAQNQILVGSQSESSIAVPKNTRELSARLEDPSRLWAPLGSL